MPRFFAFLRAINVGGHVVKMERLRELFTECGFAKVETFIASGNVIFETRAQQTGALEAKIERHLKEALGYEVTTLLRSEAELAKAAKHRAFPPRETEADAAVVYIGFLKKQPTPAAAKLLQEKQGEIDAFKIVGRELYWLCRKRFSESEFTGAKIEKILGQRMTVRNTTTVRKLAAKYPSA